MSFTLLISFNPTTELRGALILNRFLFASVFNLVCSSILSLLSFEELLEISFSFCLILAVLLLLKLPKLLLFCSRLVFKLFSLEKEFLPELDNLILTTFEEIF